MEALRPRSAWQTPQPSMWLGTGLFWYADKPGLDPFPYERQRGKRRLG
jgi:hypothetical protein